MTIALAVGLTAATLCAVLARIKSGRPPGGDFSGAEFYQIWYMLHALRIGLDPYAAGCPLKPPCADAFQYHPLTAGLSVWPLGLLTPGRACVAFVGVSAALLAYALTRDGYTRVPMLLSWPFAVAASNGQWAPLLVAASLLPGLEWLYASKPQLGLALFVSRPSWRAVLLGAEFLAISLLVLPGCPQEWIRSAMHSPYVRRARCAGLGSRR